MLIPTQRREHEHQQKYEYKAQIALFSMHSCIVVNLLEPEKQHSSEPTITSVESRHKHRPSNHANKLQRQTY